MTLTQSKRASANIESSTIKFKSARRLRLRPYGEETSDESTVSKSTCQAARCNGVCSGGICRHGFCAGFVAAIHPNQSGFESRGCGQQCRLRPGECMGYVAKFRQP